MQVAARPASHDDLPTLLALYRALEAEMTAIHLMWPFADGLGEPIEDAFKRALSDERSFLYLGTLDDVILGFLLARIEDLLPQAKGLQIGAIRLVFVDVQAREVGVGEAMREVAMSDLRQHGIRKFDAHVLPGHRLVKNFFEAGGFAARSIIMHHSDE
jgi:ribosomal protein S18 acetylase RimI-like enzyme